MNINDIYIAKSNKIDNFWLIPAILLSILFGWLIANKGLTIGIILLLIPIISSFFNRSISTTTYRHSDISSLLFYNANPWQAHRRSSIWFRARCNSTSYLVRNSISQKQPI